MYELKTREHDGSVEDYLRAIEPEQKQQDCRQIAEIMADVTGFTSKMWGASIVGFGKYRYRYESGHQGEAALTGFSSRKRNITIYIMAGFDEYEQLIERLGTFKTGKTCLYLIRLEDVDREVLRELIGKSVEHMKATNAG